MAESNKRPNQTLTTDSQLVLAQRIRIPMPPAATPSVPPQGVNTVMGNREQTTQVTQKAVQADIPITSSKK